MARVACSGWIGHGYSIQLPVRVEPRACGRGNKPRCRHTTPKHTCSFYLVKYRFWPAACLRAAEPRRLEPPHCSYINSVGTLVGHRPRFRSTFAPADARPPGTGWNGRGRQGTAEAVGRPFAHVTRDNRGRVGMGRDPRGDGASVCKIAGVAYEGPLNLALAPNSVRVDGPGRSARMGRYGLNGGNYDRPVDGHGFLAATVTRLLVQSASRPLWRGRHGSCHRWAMASRGSEAPPSLA
jgi:hypothetical protein